jgi:hypothetical protein
MKNKKNEMGIIVFLRLFFGSGGENYDLEIRIKIWWKLF